MKRILIYILASISWFFCAISWGLVKLSENLSENNPRLRGFWIDQKSLWDHLTKKDAEIVLVGKSNALTKALKDPKNFVIQKSERENYEQHASGMDDLE